MEKNLNDKDLLNKDWKYLTEYEPDTGSTEIGRLTKNLRKNRYENVLPCKTLKNSIFKKAFLKNFKSKMTIQ